ncbi:tail fiber domain-containing protein [Citrobacter sp. FDAARGOS_156]|uniref:tail fiber domain-containing protein n=1 Tax=Citrobacter sp. FDAARGOS_156 TaxID=1702170 RepID=UPI0018FFBAB8|nr:tail fiber domain-containing protein [Citrobacter sp. FDAARGOS_156]EIS7449299.1 tail fiber domain-containing protein [Citrobacter youngae]MBJ9160601.1 tail fiber domain-containing protein [Citrobacter sp. FDAARGOS_156]
MSAGTLTLTNNSAQVSGAGTSFSTELAAGDFIVVTVGGVPYTLPVKTVESNAGLTLVSNFTGPTQSGAAWSAVPRVALNMVTAALVTQSAEALRGLNYDKQNWQQVFSGTGTITVRLPDGTTFSGPAWNSITTTLNQKASKGVNGDITSLTGLTTPLSVTQGGTGGSSPATARASLELTSAATTSIGNSGNSIPLLSGANTWSATQVFTGGLFTSSATGNANIGMIKNVPDGSLANTQGPLLVSRIATNDTSRCEAQFFANFDGGSIRRALIQITSDASVAANFALVEDGNINGRNGSVQWNGSDVRIKYGFEPASDRAGERIDQIGVMEYCYKGSNQRRRGFLAQQMTNIDDRYTFFGGTATDENGHDFEVMNVDDRAIIADLVVVVQELRREISILKNTGSSQ